MTCNRRGFLATATAAAISSLNAQTTYEWDNPVLDIHLHARVGPGVPNLEGGESAHINGSGVMKAVLLTHADAAEHSKQVVAPNPDRFVWSVSTDVNKPGAIDLLRRNLKSGRDRAGRNVIRRPGLRQPGGAGPLRAGS